MAKNSPSTSTPPTFNKQEIFDIASVHLIRQDKRSVYPTPTSIVGETGCAYRGDGGCACAIGALIPDDKYDPAMENHSVWSLIEAFPAALAHLGVTKGSNDNGFLGQLQGVHDGSGPIRWPAALRNLAKEHGLTTSAMDNFIAENPIGISTPLAA